MTKASERITADRIFENYYIDTDSSLSHYPQRQASKEEEQKQDGIQTAAGEATRRQNRNRFLYRENLVAIMLHLGWAGVLGLVVSFIVLSVIKDVRI